MKPKVVIVDLGISNILSAKQALEYVGCSVSIATDATGLKPPHKIVIPGVGSFPEAIKRMRKTGLDKAIMKAHQERVPLLGVCLGMQLLFKRSSENGGDVGLKILDGEVKKLAERDQNGYQLLVPSIGWNKVVCSDYKKANSILFELIDSNDFYFVHSFECIVKDENLPTAHYVRGDKFVKAVVTKDEVWGVQFHPEKSGLVGLDLLETFVRMT